MFRNCQKILGSGFRNKVAAINLSPLDTYKYPKEVKWEIDQDNKNDYLKFARDINEDSSVSGVILQHEYGIFGGIEGENVLYFMEKCQKPILVTLHTALPLPTLKMRQVTSRIIELASNVVVLTKSSKEVIEHVYPQSRGKISIIPHGIHYVPFSLKDDFKDKLELNNHIVLSTFGLLSRGKGIEYVIKALPSVIKKYPSLLYLILGETHPVIRRNEGEKYRMELAQLITKLGLEKYVKFYDQYLSLPDLLKFLQATDIYISSSINPNQAVSGTLSYALGTGRAVISTEFAQAKEIVTPEMGRLVPIKDSKAISSALLELLSNKQNLKVMDRHAYDKTRSMLWSNVARKYTNLLIRTIVPPINLSHLYKMTDSFGLFQFAHLSIPDKNLGYTLDDNARALIVCIWLIEKKYNKKILSLINKYFNFIKICQRKDGSFTNYIGFPDKSPTTQNDQEDLEDTHARAMWALSEIMNSPVLSIKMKNEARSMYLSSLKKGLKLTHIRAKAMALKSFVLSLKVLPRKQKLLSANIKIYADALTSVLKANSLKDWCWFEKDLKYNNAILSEVLFIAGNHLKNPVYIKNGIETLQFLISKTFTSDMYAPIGHSHWYKNKSKRSQYDQQPEDPASMILALVYAYRCTHNEQYKNLAKKCFSWFLGNNSVNKTLYDGKTGGCYDGLHPNRVNLNQGAESLISYLMSSYKISMLNG